MDHFGVIMSLIGVMFLAIIGVYVWTYKVYKDTKDSLGDVYRTVNGHLQNTKVHANANDGFVSTKLCTVMHTALKDTVDEIKTDVKCLLRKTGSQSDEG